MQFSENFLCSAAFPIFPDKFQKFFGKIAPEQNAVIIRRAFKLLHEQTVAVKPARQDAAEKISLLAQNIHNPACPGFRQIQTDLKNDSFLLAGLLFVFDQSNI